MNVCVIGFGKMGMLHAGVVNGLTGHKVVAVSENGKFVAGAVKSLVPHMTVYEDYLRMLDHEKPDAAFITTPVHMHVDMCLECVKRGIPFFVEKPLALDAADARRLVDALEKKPVVNMVGYMMRHIGTFRKAAEIVRSGALGALISWNATLYVTQLFKQGKGWRYDKTKSGGGLMMGPTSHVLDLALWYFGVPSGVNAWTSNFYSGATEDFLHMNLWHESGARGWLDSSWSVRGHRLVESRIEAHGSRGMMIVTDDDLRVFLDEPAAGLAKGWTVLQKPQLQEHCEIDIGGPQYTLEDAAFLAAVEAGKPLECDVRSSYDVHKVITAMYESSEDRGNFRAVAP